ncbi:MAG TPA: XisI protein [Chthonomonadaceae bacterium]|nr:XisI protein [Chthonomonadaceae bacterium]
MDRLNTYRALVRKVICSSPYFVHGSVGPNVETQFLGDDANARYLLVDIGWRGKERVFKPILYVCIKQEKIWIEEDWTEDGIAEELMRLGVPKEDIVLAFHHPKLRPYTDFAVA